jgi:hypothetical protein
MTTYLGALDQILRPPRPRSANDMHLHEAREVDHQPNNVTLGTDYSQKWIQGTASLRSKGFGAWNVQTFGDEARA